MLYVDLDVAKRIIKYVESLQLADKDDYKKLSNCAKRMSNMIMSDGLVRTILFAFSKAKIKEINNYLSNINVRSEKLSESKRWAVVTGIIVNEYLKAGIDQTGEADLLVILDRLNKGEMGDIDILEQDIIRCLDTLSRIFESYSGEE